MMDFQCDKIGMPTASPVEHTHPFANDVIAAYLSGRVPEFRALAELQQKVRAILI